MKQAEIVRGTAAHVRSGRLYISTTKRLAAIGLKTDRVIWEKRYEDHCCDRLAVSPDGQTIYAPAFERAKWFVVRADNGELRATVGVIGLAARRRSTRATARAPISARGNRRRCGWSTRSATRIVRMVGPFSASLCPFTVNAKGTLAFANVDGLVGFEVGDLQTGLILDRVAVEDYDKDAAAQFECPSHGIAFTPDERELWVADGVRNRIEIFDAREYPPVASSAIAAARSAALAGVQQRRRLRVLVDRRRHQRARRRRS